MFERSCPLTEPCGQNPRGKPLTQKVQRSPQDAVRNTSLSVSARRSFCQGGLCFAARAGIFHITSYKKAIVCCLDQ